MIAPRPWCACLLAVLLLTPVCSAGDNGLSRVELGRRGKAATALVEIKNAAVYGSVFCIHSSNPPGPRANPWQRMSPTPKPVGRATTRLPGRDKPLAIVKDLDLTVPQEDAITTELTFNKRVHLIPDARLIITIPTTNDRLILYRYAE